jgi:hypothetical protein
MKIVVLYDRDDEKGDAEHMAEVLTYLGPQLLYSDIEVKQDMDRYGHQSRTVMVRQGSRWSSHLHDLKVVALQTRDVLAQSTDQALRMEVALGER